MLVGLTSYSQSYPIAKTIGKDSVVIINMRQAEQINKSHIKLTKEIDNLENKSLILDMQRAQGYALVEAYDREYKRANIKIENLNLQLEDKDKEVAFLKRKINRTIFQGMLLVVGWTVYTGMKSGSFPIINTKL
jgi:predicted RNase H-like nuclease (RuvC/YqgF family)